MVETLSFLHCLQNNSIDYNYPLSLLATVQRRRKYWRYAWKADFTNVLSSTNYKYLLIFSDISTGWIAMFQTWAKKALEVSKSQVKGIIPYFCFFRSIKSCNKPSSVSNSAVTDLIISYLLTSCRCPVTKQTWRSQA